MGENGDKFSTPNKNLSAVCKTEDLDNSNSTQGLGKEHLGASGKDLEQNDTSRGERSDADTSSGTNPGMDADSLSSQPTTSTPLCGDINVNPRRGSVRFDTDSISISDSISRDSISSRESLIPEQISVPIQGYEIMEERAKFTVFKIKVEKSEGDSWFVFRRYTDFVQLNEKLRRRFPRVRLSLPPKRWFKDNFDKNFIEDRVLGLQTFVDNCICHKEICNSRPVREFFCFDDPPGPHDSLEESRALCENLEDSVYKMRKELSEKDAEISLLQEELGLYKNQVEMLTQALREKNSGGRSLESPASTSGTSLTEYDLSTCPEADQSQLQASAAGDSPVTREKMADNSATQDKLIKNSGVTASAIQLPKKKFGIFSSKSKSSAPVVQS